MRLWHTKNVWSQLARKDPYWAVLTDPDKSENRWQTDEFFATGHADVAANMTAIAKHLPHLRKERALDFGCGVGRLTQALAGHFQSVTGVDVAAPMLDLARTHNQQPDKVNYVHNPTSNLKQFPDATFDLIYSVITLQHIPPSLIRGYLKEFCRVCRPEGAIYFQLPATSPPKQWQFSWYLPTAWMRIKRSFFKSILIRPEMSMNSLKKDEVLAILTNSHAEIIKITPDTAAHPLESYTYLSKKGSGRV